MKFSSYQFKKNISSLILFKTFSRAYDLLSSQQRKKALLNLFLIIWNAFFEVFSLASVLPFILLVLDISLIHSNPYLSIFYSFFEFQSETHFLFAATLCLVCLFVIKNIMNLWIVNFQSKFTYGIATTLSENTFFQSYDKDYLSFIQTNSSQHKRNILFIPIEFSAYVLLGTIQLISEFIVLLLIIIAIATYHFHVLVLLGVILTPPIWILYRLKDKKLKEIGENIAELNPQSMEYLSGAINSYIDIKLYHKEQYFARQFLSVQKSLNQTFARFHTLNQLPLKIIETAAVFGVSGLIIYSVLFLETRNEIILLLTVFTASAYRIMPSINRILIALTQIKTFQYTIDTLHDVRQNSRFDRIQDVSQSYTFTFDKTISFKNISFVYPRTKTFTLSHITFTVNKGEIVGFIGKSGSGKTTLIHILLRFLIERSGQILVDGHPLRPEDTSAWRNLIGYVKQSPFILNGSIAENVAFGKTAETIQSAQLQKAVRRSGLADFIAALPKGINTQIGEGGSKLSGGQKQRIAIARALYRNAEILIFDEATSELDHQTEQEIINAIEQLSNQHKTIFVIAHRITTLKQCDTIYELQNGEIVKTYKYDELIKTRL